MGEGNPFKASVSKNLQAIFLAGPTGVGKSEIALKLAALVGGEIISVDSMQVYRGMDIGTAKPSKPERERIHHHIIDVVDVGEEFDGARFGDLAAEAVDAASKRGKVPIFCGGTGLYFQSYLEGLGKSPPRDPDLRAELEELSLEELREELRAKDPAMSENIDLKNKRRLVRAIEVIRITGKAFSAQRACWKARGKEKTGHRSDRMFLMLQRSKEELDLRIENRVDLMFSEGIVLETEALIRKGLESNQTAMQAIGYRQVLEYLKRKRSLRETIQIVKQRTRAYAKRQRTWFRNQLDAVELDVGGGRDSDSIAEELAEKHGIIRETKPLQPRERAV